MLATQEHRLVRDGALFRCETCTMTWKSKPRTGCYGLPVLRWGAVPAGLATEVQLKQKRLVPAQDARPVALVRGKEDKYALYREAETVSLDTRPDLELRSVPQLLERGWTDTLIKRFLGAPDDYRDNPYYKGAAPMRLYAMTRVLAAEQTDAWKQASIRASARREAGKATAARKAAELVEAARTMPVRVTILPGEQLVQRAIASYNKRQHERAWEREQSYEWQPASMRSDPAFLDRISVNYIRHHLTQYDDQLETVAGQVGVREAEAMIRSRIYAEIARAYPGYREEVERQIAYRAAEEVQL